MEYINSFVETVCLLSSAAASVVFTILNINYWLLNTIISAVWNTASLILSTLCLICEGIILAADEFKLFLIEITGGIQAVFIIIRNLGKVLLSLVTLLLNSVSAVYSNVTTETGSLVKSIGSCIYYSVIGLKDLVILFCSSVVLILESLPWSISTVFNGTVQIASLLLKSFVKGCNETTANTINFFKDTYKTIAHKIYNIPRDAYIGLAILIVIFLMHRYMKVTIIRLLRKALRLSKKVLRRTYRAYQQLVRFLLRCVRNVNAFCMLLLRYLPQMNNSGVHDVNDASDDESDEPQQSGGSDNESVPDELAPRTISKLRRELESQKGAQSCIVCLENPKNMIFLPCRHMCACEECCETLVYRRAPCPLCRKFIRNTIRVYT